MKITESRPIRDTVVIRSATPTAGAGVVAPPYGGIVRQTVDVATIAGIPDTELTPKVRVAIEMLMAEVQRLREDLTRAQQRVGYLEKLADEDSLVPVANRRAFVRELSRSVALAERYGTAASVLYFDINGMKAINDQHGHAAGDAALKHVGEILTNSVRESDIVGRLGGDEFGVILVQTDTGRAVEKADSLASAIAANPFEWNGNVLGLSVAYGAHTARSQENAGEALEQADKAMYAHKQGLV